MPPPPSSFGAVAVPMSPPPKLNVPEMSAEEQNYARLIKVGCLVIIALAVIYMAAEKLEKILIPFFLALAFSYLLTPLIDFFSCRNVDGCVCRMPRALAVLLSFIVACAVLISLALIIVHALSTFKARSSLYRERMEEVLEAVFAGIEYVEMQMGHISHSREEKAGKSNIDEVTEMVQDFVKEISITNVIISLLGTAAHTAEDLMYILWPF